MVRDWLFQIMLLRVPLLAVLGPVRFSPKITQPPNPIGFKQNQKLSPSTNLLKLRVSRPPVYNEGMKNIDGDMIDLFFALLPGLLAATVFHSVTPYPKRDIFDRIVNALIFTAVGQMFVGVSKPIALMIGKYFSLGIWNENTELWHTSAGATICAILLAYSLNNDLVHKSLRFFKITKRVSYPSQWYSAHSNFENYITIELRNGRRILAWPQEWPDSPDNGHYVLTNASWVLDNGEQIPLPDIRAMMIDTSEVERVEFMIDIDDKIRTARASEIEQSHAKMNSYPKDTSSE